MPKCEFEIEIPEGFASGEVIGGKYTNHVEMLFKPIKMKLRRV